MVIFLVVWILMTLYFIRICVLTSQIDYYVNAAMKELNNCKWSFKEMELEDHFTKREVLLYILLAPLFLVILIGCKYSLTESDISEVPINPFLNPKLSKVLVSKKGLGFSERRIYYLCGVYVAGCTAYSRKELVEAIKGRYPEGELRDEYIYYSNKKNMMSYLDCKIIVNG